MKKLIQILFILTVFFISSHSFAATPIDWNINAATNIDTRIDAKNNPALNKKVYGAMNYTLYQQRKFTRNTQCWAYDLDLTCASAFNNRGGMQRAGTLITPRHVILAAHFPYTVGDSVYFITKDNQTIRRKVIAELTTDISYYPDIQLVTLDSGVPSNITPCLFLPSNFGTYLKNNGKGLPSLYFDQDENALVADIQMINSGGSFVQQMPTALNRKVFFEEVITGDSGDPVFLILNNKLVLLNCFTFSSGGTALTYFANLVSGGTFPEQSLDDMIATVDAKVGANTGHKVKFFDFTAPLTDIVNVGYPILAKVNVNAKILNVDFSDYQNDTRLQIFNLLGNEITTQTINNSNFSYQLPSSGVFIITISNGHNTKSYKVLSQ